MSDGTFGIVCALSILASVGVLWLRWQQRRAMRRLLESLDEKQLQILGEALKKDQSG